MIPSRKREIGEALRHIARTLESREEVQYAVDCLRARGRELGRHSIVAHETLSRQFLQQRHQLFGQMPGPWPIEFVAPLEVWHKKEGFDFAAGKAYTKKWEARISRARFVALGQRSLGRYVELEVKVDELIPPADQQEYGYKAGEALAVYCTLRTLITARPQWVMDTQARVRIARARALAAAAYNKGEVQP